MEQVTEFSPTDWHHLFKQASDLHAQGQLEPARRIYLQLIVQQPQNPPLIKLLGMLETSAANLPMAQRWLQLACQLDPRDLESRNKLTHLLEGLGQYEAALEQASLCVAQAPDNANLHYNRGRLLHQLDRFEEAVEAYDRALQRNPQFVAAAFNRGNSLRELLRLPEAIASYVRALELEPDNANFHWTLALTYLLHGEYTLGWQHFERRWERDGSETRRIFEVPQWTGREPIAGKTLLIHGEQGLGDVIQFCRYALDVIALGGRVVFGGPPTLHPLLRSMAPGLIPIIDNSEHPDFDFHCPAMSLPHAFATTLATVPAHSPYFYADAACQAAWGKLLQSHTKRRPRVGLVWFGNPKHLHDHRRSLSLEALMPLLQLPLDFHSLQQSVRPQDQALLAQLPQLQSHTELLTTLTQTAALIAELDLVVTVDTSIAHLAGALGKPVWILLHQVPDYRWLLDREDSPWYPSARLFRQTRRDSWAEVVEKVSDALVQHFALTP